MEALAVVGLAAAIAQFVSYSTKIIARLNDFRADSQNAPNAFNTLGTQLTVLRANLEKTGTLADNGQLDSATQQIIEAVVKDCLYQGQRIEAMLDKVAPNSGDSKIRRGMKIVLSVHQGSEIEEICKCIDRSVLYLIHHQTSTIQSTIPSRPLSQRPVNLSVMPFPKDENFAGRAQQLKQLDDLLKTGNRAALFGLGGVGKSQIAIEYSHRFLEADPNAIVLWIYASSVSRIDQAFEKIAAKAKLPGFDKQDVSKYELVHNWLSEEASSSWLMILDNADVEDTFFNPLDSTLHPGQKKRVIDFIPTAPNGKALFTSRSKATAMKLIDRNRKRIIEVPNISEEDGREMLANAIGEDKLEEEAEVKRLLETLEYLPLAIAQAAAYIEENDVTIADYLEILGNTNKDMLTQLTAEMTDSRRDRDSLDSVVATWQLSFDYLRRQKPEAANLLSLMSVLDCKSIPERLLSSLDLTKNDFTKALGVLKSFSLVSVIAEEKKDKKYIVHRLIHLATRVWIEKEGDAIGWHQKALDSVGKEFPAGEAGDWIECNELEPHVEAIIDSEVQDEAHQIHMVDLMVRSAKDRYNQGHTAKAMARASKAFDLSRGLPEESARDHWIVKSMSILSWCHFQKKDFENAIKVSEQVLALLVSTVGEDTPETLQARSRLSKFLMKHGDLARAYEMQAAILDLQRAKLGSDHNDTLFTMNRLVATLRKLKRYDEALALSKELVETRSKAFGKDHHATLTCLANRAELLNTVGRRQEAMVAMKRAYEGFRSAFGEERGDTKEALECLQRYNQELEESAKLEVAAKEEAGDAEKPDQLGKTVELVFSPALGSPDPSTAPQWPFPTQEA